MAEDISRVILADPCKKHQFPKTLQLNFNSCKIVANDVSFARTLQTT